MIKYAENYLRRRVQYIIERDSFLAGGIQITASQFPVPVRVPAGRAGTLSCRIRHGCSFAGGVGCQIEDWGPYPNAARYRDPRSTQPVILWLRNYHWRGGLCCLRTTLFKVWFIDLECSHANQGLRYRSKKLSACWNWKCFKNFHFSTIETTARRKSSGRKKEVEFLPSAIKKHQHNLNRRRIPVPKC